MAHETPEAQKPLMKTRAGVSLIAFLAVIGFLLLFEHRAHIPGNYLVLGVLLAGCMIIHLFMHGGHGGHTSGDPHGEGHADRTISGDGAPGKRIAHSTERDPATNDGEAR